MTTPRGGGPKLTRSTNLTLTTSILITLFFISYPITLSSADEGTTQSTNITSILSSYPELSTFTSLLTSTAVITDVTTRSSLTILAVTNPHILPSTVTTASSSTPLSDILRYHILLRYLTWHDLRQIPPSGTLIPTLYQTTGRASDNFGSLNLTFNSVTGIVTLRPPLTSTSSPPSNQIPNFISSSSSSSSTTSRGSTNTTSTPTPPPPPNSATIQSLIKSYPYNLSIFTVSSLLIPYTSDLVASETHPSSPSLNITKTLIDGHGFNVAASMLSASGVIDEFEADEAGAGITLFVPTDGAYSNLPPSVELQALSADQKALVLKYHVLHSYYPLGSLESIVNPLQPTLATEDSGAGSFTLNISRVNGSVALNSGVVEAIVTQTVFDQNPVAIFGISRVLLPKEMFGGKKDLGDGSVNLGARNGSGGVLTAPPPGASGGDDTAGGGGGVESPEVNSPPSLLSSPPGLRDEVESSGRRMMMTSVCTGGCSLLLLLYLLLSVGL